MTVLEDTFLVLSDVVGTPKPAALARMEKDLEAARALPPDSTLMTVRESIDGLAASAAEVVRDLPPSLTAMLCWWARAFEAQCRAALDELTLCAALGSTPHLPGSVLKDAPLSRQYPDPAPIGLP